MAMVESAQDLKLTLSSYPEQYNEVKTQPMTRAGPELGTAKSLESKRSGCESSGSSSSKAKKRKSIETNVDISGSAQVPKMRKLVCKTEKTASEDDRRIEKKRIQMETERPKLAETYEPIVKLSDTIKRVGSFVAINTKEYAEINSPYSFRIGVLVQEYASSFDQFFDGTWLLAGRRYVECQLLDYQGGKTFRYVPSSKVVIFERTQLLDYELQMTTAQKLSNAYWNRMNVVSFLAPQFYELVNYVENL
jgi:hypothetical protein